MACPNTSSGGFARHSKEHQPEDEPERAASAARRELPAAPHVAERDAPTLRDPGGKDGAWRPYASEPDLREGTDPAGRPIGHKSAPVSLSWGETPTRVFAFVGEGAPEAASRVAKLFAEAAREEDAYVLAVDAAGGELFERLSGEETVTPDLYLERGEADSERLAPHVASVDGLQALKVVAPPANADLPAFALVEAATLTSALRAEEVRGRNGTLLCTSAALEKPQGAGPLYEPEVDGRRLYALGGEGGERASLELAAALTSPERATADGEVSR